MGSIASHPKIPAVPATVYVPVYTPATTTAAATGTADTGASSAASSGSTAATDTTAATGVQKSNLLDRGRGVLSTVLTGFRGLLNDTNVPQRKSLLGE